MFSWRGKSVLCLETRTPRFDRGKLWYSTKVLAVTNSGYECVMSVLRACYEHVTSASLRPHVVLVARVSILPFGGAQEKETSNAETLVREETTRDQAPWSSLRV